MWKLEELDVWPVSVEMGELRNSQSKPERSWRRTTMKRKVLRNLNIRQKNTWEFQQLLFPRKCGWQPCRYTYLCCALGVAVAEVSGADQKTPDIMSPRRPPSLQILWTMEILHFDLPKSSGWSKRHEHCESFRRFHMLFWMKVLNCGTI